MSSLVKYYIADLSYEEVAKKAISYTALACQRLEILVTDLRTTVIETPLPIGREDAVGLVLVFSDRQSTLEQVQAMVMQLVKDKTVNGRIVWEEFALELDALNDKL